MTIRTTFRERMFRSFVFLKTELLSLAVVLMVSLPMQLTAQCPPDITFTGSSELDEWIAPDAGGIYIVQIEATGAGGGNAVGSGNNGGGGANVFGTFEIEEKQFLLIVLGGPGGNGTGGHAGGGGSGTGVVNCGFPADCGNGTVLIVAAGGNGAQTNAAGFGGSGSFAGSGAGGAGGGTDGGGGGGGLVSAGDDGGGGGGGSQVISTGLASGGTGSQGAANAGGEGMGGGGGGGLSATEGSGGGAGNDGGAGGNVSSVATSFNSGTNDMGFPGGTGTGPNIGSVIIRCTGFLPVKLINFKAVIQGEDVKLVWITATEQDNLGYDLERSADNRNWSAIGFVPGNGTTAQKSEYTFTDDRPFAGINYYRLKQMDFDGKHEYSPIVVADLKSNGLLFDVFPNPSTGGALSVRTVSQQEGDAQLELFNWSGYRVYKETQHLYKGTTVWPVSLATYPKGAYTARLQMPDGTSQFKKIVLQ